MLTKPPLSAHFIDCGQGNMTLLVTPTAVLLADCRVTADDEERILKYLATYIPERIIDGEKQRWIDWFICSHRDNDHIHGLRTVTKHFPVRGIVDPGTTSGSTDGDANEYYMYLRRKLIDEYGEDAVVVPTPSAIPWRDFDGVKFYCLCSGEGDGPSVDGHYGNNVFQVEYAGNRVLLPGDSDWQSWKDRIMPMFQKSGLLKTTVLLASHHGSRSFFVPTDFDVDEDEAWEEAYEDHLKELSPSMTIISSGDYSHCHHPNKTAMKKYRAATKHEQVYLNRDKGTLVGQFHSDGRWTVTPSSFLNGWKLNHSCPTGKSMMVRCRATKNGVTQEVESGATLPIGQELEFEVTTSGGLIGSKLEATYTFEVSNGGMGADCDHDEIYKKSSGESGPPNMFRRQLSFLGTHFLRCKVKQGPGQAAQRVFAIRGVAA